MKINNCPRFEKCSASICVLDPNWQKSCHLKNEKVCFFLCEAQKNDSEAVFRDRGLQELYQLIVEATPDISLRWKPIKRALEKARKTSSRMTRKFSSRNKSCGVTYAKS